MNHKASTFFSDTEEEFSKLVHRAQEGDAQLLSIVLEDFRKYLLVIADGSISNVMQAKISATDLVQDSLIEAQGDFDGCRGSTRDEIKHWLRRILLNNLINQFRDWKRQKRDVDRERQLDLNKPIIDEDEDTPSVFAMRKENESRLTIAMTHLSADYQQVIELALEDLSYVEIGKRMDRSADAARKLWNRAVEMLSSLMTDE